MSGIAAARVAEVEAVEAQVGGEALGNATAAGAIPGLLPAQGSPGEGTSGVAVGSGFGKMHMDYVDGVALQNFDFVASMEKKEGFEGSEAWKSVQKSSESMGYMLEEDDPWKFLGISKMESAEPDKNYIKGRASILNDFLESVSDAYLDPEEKMKRAMLVVKMEDAKSRCLKELPEVTRLRKESRSGKDKLMRWGEIDNKTEEWLGQGFPESTFMALNLSSILSTRTARRTRLRQL